MHIQENTSDPQGMSWRHVAWTPLVALLVTIGAYIMSMVFAAFCNGILVAVHQTWPSVLQGQQAFTEMLFTAFSSVGLLGFLGLYLRSRNMSFKTLGFRTPTKSDALWLLCATAAYFLLLIVAMTLMSLVPGFDVNQQQNIGYVGVSGLGLLFAFVGLVVLPPLAEEMLFRGFLYRGLASRWPQIAAAIVTSALFGLVHLQWNVAVDTFLLSLVLIWLLEKTKNLWLCVALHAIKNGVAFYVLFL